MTVVPLKREDGQAMVTGLLVLAGVLIPLLVIVPLFSRVETARLAAEQAARDAVRSAVTAPSPGQATLAAQRATTRASQASGTQLSVNLSGRFARGEVLLARITARVPVVNLGGNGIGGMTVKAAARAPVDRYRSLAP